MKSNKLHRRLWCLANLDSERRMSNSQLSPSERFAGEHATLKWITTVMLSRGVGSFCLSADAAAVETLYFVCLSGSCGGGWSCRRGPCDQTKGNSPPRGRDGICLLAALICRNRLVAG